MSSHTTIAALAAACALAGAGCEATITPAAPAFAFEGSLVAPATIVPADVWAYPRVYFGGSYAYLVNGAWYQETPRGWVVYRREPVELFRARTRIYASPARPSPRQPAYGYPRPAPLEEPHEYGRSRTPQPR